ncbi:MAG: hypothetical protein WAK17_19385 [Candidatus Nitrosopolaris sp.]|jgi:hypothetical protein
MSFEVYHKNIEERERKDQEVLELKEQMSKMQQDYKSYDDLVKEVFGKVQQVRREDERRQEKEDERGRVLYDMLDKELPGWNKRYRELLGIVPRSLTKEEQEKVEQMLEWMRTHPNTDNTEDAD